MKLFYPVWVDLPENEDQIFGLRFPDFPNCFSAAETIEKIPAMVNECLQFYYEDSDFEWPRPNFAVMFGPSQEDYPSGKGFWCVVEVEIKHGRGPFTADGKPMEG